MYLFIYFSFVKNKCGWQVHSVSQFISVSLSIYFQCVFHLPLSLRVIIAGARGNTMLSHISRPPILKDQVNESLIALKSLGGGGWFPLSPFQMHCSHGDQILPRIIQLMQAEEGKDTICVSNCLFAPFQSKKLGLALFCPKLLAHIGLFNCYFNQ